MSPDQPLPVWLTATSVRAIQIGIDLTGIASTSLVLALFLVGVVLAHIVVLLTHERPAP